MNGRGYWFFFAYFIETSEIYAEAEGFIFIEGEDYQSTMGGGSLVDKSSSEMVIEEVVENFKLGLRERIHWNDQRRSSFFQINFEIVRWCRGSFSALALLKTLAKL